MYQLTDEGKRELMRNLSYELSDKMIAELMDQFADGVNLDRNDEPFIEIDRNDVLICAASSYKHYIDVNHVEKVIVNEEDYE
jgi:DNA-binding PadR family transcriptional regulator